MGKNQKLDHFDCELCKSGATKTSFDNQDLFGFCLVITDTMNNFTTAFIHIVF